VITSDFDAPSAVAVSVAFCNALTAVAVTLKVAEVSSLDTVTEPGARSALLLLDSFTTVWLVVAAVRDTEQTSVCAPVIEFVPHESPFKVATGAGVVGLAGYSMITSDFEAPSAVAVSVAFCEAFTAAAVTLKGVEVPPFGTVTEAGARRALLLLESVTNV